MQYLSKSHILNLTTNTLNNTQPSSLCAFMMIRKTHTVYSGKLSLVQNFAEMRPDFRRNFSQFYFRTLLYKSWWPRPTCEPKKNDNERPREKASLCNNGLVFLCVKAFAITKVSRPLPRAKKTGERIQHCWSQPFDNFGASLTGSLEFSSRLLFLYSDHLEGR